MIFASLICLVLGIPLAFANVEKTIFLGPEPINIPDQQPSLSALNIDTLTPESWSLRTHLEATFPTESSKHGSPSWFILDNLTEGQRYEVRICWLATQPTDFHLETYTLPAVFDTPELITSLHNFSTSRQASPPSPPSPPSPAVQGYYSMLTTSRRKDESNDGGGDKDHLSSVLLLRIDAAAAYFTTDRELMLHPEPVLADVILDPFLLNVLPRSLLPTVGYIVIVAAASWVLASRFVMPWVRGIMIVDDGEDGGADGQHGSGPDGEEGKKTR